MSRPDKQPEGFPRDGGADGPDGGDVRPPGRAVGPVGGGPAAGRAGGRFREARAARPGDLRALPFPPGDWGEPAARLEELYRWAETGALRTADWYLADRRRKRRAARAARAVTMLGAGAALALPVAQLTAGGHGPGGVAVWGYAGALAAAAGLGADRWFGLTSGWIRDVATAQAVQRRLEALRFDWASESVREVLGPAEGTASEAAERCLTVLRRFCEDVSELVRGETAEWMVAFRAGPAPLHTQSLVFRDTRDGGAPPVRFPAPPAHRPSMPRQRPPEGPGGR